MRPRVRLVCAFIVAIAVPSAAAGAPPLTLMGKTSIPGYTGDFDHMAADLKRHHLFLAAEDHGTVEVFDDMSGKHEATLKTFETPHAFFMVPGTDRMIVTDSGKGFSKIIDLSDYRVLGTIKLAPGADSETYDASTGRLYIVTGGKDVDMKQSYLNEIDPKTGKLLRQLRFDSDHTEALRAEQNGSRIFINVADHDYVSVVDKKSLREIARWPIQGAKLNLCMALDEADHRLFIVTRNPSKLFVLDTDSGKTVAKLDVPAIVDGLFYDKARKRIYVPGGDGFVGVYQQQSPDKYTDLARVPSAIGGKSGALVPALNRLYIAASPGKRVGGEVLWYQLPPAAGR